MSTVQMEGGITIITIKEFCEKYRCDYSGIYKKVKRKKSELCNHIFSISGKLVLDEYAENLLMPTERHSQNRKNEETAKAYKEMEYRLQRRLFLTEDKLRECSETINSLNEKIKNLESDKFALIKENENLKKQISELTAKPKGWLSRK